MAEYDRHFVRPEKRRSPVEYIASRQLRSKLTVQEKAESLDEVAISDGKRTVVLNTHLPEFVRFNGRRGNRFLFGEDIEEFPDPSLSGAQLRPYSLVFFSPEEADTLEGRIALLHEIGHAMLRRNEKRGRYRYYLRLAEDVISYVRDEDEYKNIEPSKQVDYLLRTFKERWAEKNKQRVRDGEDPISNEMLVEAMRARVKDEREASANAMRLYRRILKENRIDIFDGISSDDLFKVITEISLRSHEEQYGFLLSLEKAQ